MKIEELNIQISIVSHVTIFKQLKNSDKPYQIHSSAISSWHYYKQVLYCVDPQ